MMPESYKNPIRQQKIDFYPPSHSNEIFGNSLEKITDPEHLLNNLKLFFKAFPTDERKHFCEYI